MQVSGILMVGHSLFIILMALFCQRICIKATQDLNHDSHLIDTTAYDDWVDNDGNLLAKRQMPGVMRFGKRATASAAQPVKKTGLPRVMRFGKRQLLADEGVIVPSYEEDGSVFFEDEPLVILNEPSPSSSRASYGKKAMPGVMRFGKREQKRPMPGVMRFGKRFENKRPMPGVMRFGKRQDAKRPMPGVMRFGKK